MLNLSKDSINHHIDKNRLHAFEVLQTPLASRYIGLSILIIMALFIILLFLPWQQNIRGTGKVTAFDPVNRPQTVETVIGGRIESLNVQEGQFIRKGDTVMIISETKEKFFDPELLIKLEEQISAKESAMHAKEVKINALKKQVKALNDALRFKLDQASNKVKQARLKVVTDSIDFETEKINYRIAEDQYNRFKILYDSGNISLNEFQSFNMKFQEASNKVVSKENKFFNTKNDLLIALVDLNTIEAETIDKISKAESDLANTRSELYESAGELSKLQNEYANMKIRNQFYVILAPQEGYVVKALQAGIGATIKEGEAVVTIMPESADKAVELYIKAMDIPLITRGRKVRLEFEGWPALQFSGWPNVAVGTFGGVVEVIDYVESSDGTYRMLVVPDKGDEPWPELLRVGSGVYGWALLDTVPIWFEMWRQLNGFPPSLKQKPEKEKNDNRKE